MSATTQAATQLTAAVSLSAYVMPAPGSSQAEAYTEAVGDVLTFICGDWRQQLTVTQETTQV